MAFAPVSTRPRFGVFTSTTTTTTSSLAPLFMFSGDDPKPLSEVSVTNTESTTASSKDEQAEDVAATIAQPTRAVYRNLGKGGEEVEVPWIDDAMRANTNPLEMSWWAYILFGLPIVLLANDFFHFLPKDGPLSFFSTL
jgi:hypothetical protein